MKFRLYKEYGALNSPEIFSAIEQGILAAGHEIVTDNEDVPVIWSVLFHGRMLANERIYDQARSQGKPVLIIEVGNLNRGKTWRISLNNINSNGIFGNTSDLDHKRNEKLGIVLQPYQQKRRGEVLVATQHERSLQWRGMPTMKKWSEDTVAEIKKYTSRRILLRNHPRHPFTVKISNVINEHPRKIPNTYDDFDIFYGYHCVVNYNSGPAVQALIRGIPVICDPSSLAGEISNKIENIENLQYFPREDWFIKLCHTEWTVDEIKQGIPINRLMPQIENSLVLTL
jgi:hypothetical protein